jgi:ABC-type branched-subunit amino acid transport system substrate-binding protein
MKNTLKEIMLVKAALLSTALIAAGTVTGSADEVTVGVLVPLTGELGLFVKMVANAVELGEK